MNKILWEEIGRYWPEPNLIENRIYACSDDEGYEFEAKFCFGEGEFWWIEPATNREVRVTKFVRNRHE